MDLGFYFKLFLRRLHWFLLFLFMGSAIGIALAILLPPTYSARAVLIVESEQIPSDLAESTVTTGANEALQIIQQRILTRDRLIDMARRLNIYEAQGDAPPPRMSGDEIVRDLRSRIGINTSGTTGRSQATIVRVSFEAPTARKSADVVNEVVTMMLQENVAIRTSVAGDTLDFFRGEVERLDQELTERNARILAFQEANLNALPDSLDFRRSQQAAAQERLVSLERQEAALTDRRQRFVELYETTGQLMQDNSRPRTPAERQLDSLQSELASALVTLSPQNPRVRMLESRIAAAEQQVAAEAAAAPDLGDGPTPYELQLADIDTQLDQITDQKARIEETLAALQASIEATPANAVQLSTMQRDYAAVRAQYDQAVSNRARAETGDTIEALSKGQRITVIEPAVPPSQPDSPNRPMLAAAGVAGGMALGLGVVLLIELLKSAVRRPVDLQNALGIAPISTLPYMRTRSQTWGRRGIILGAFVLVLVGVPAGLWWMHTNVMPLDILMDRVLSRLRLAALALPATAVV